MQIQRISKANPTHCQVVIFNRRSSAGLFAQGTEEQTLLSQGLAKQQDCIAINTPGLTRLFVVADDKKPDAWALEKLRTQGHKAQQVVNELGRDTLTVVNHTRFPEASLAVAEGAALGNYQFLKYRSNAEKERNSLTRILVTDPRCTAAQLTELENVVESVRLARDLVNEPLSYLTAVQFGREMEKAGKASGFKTEVLDKKKIESLRMGGLLAVNRGSIDPPTFTIMEYKPARPRNKKPVVLVGKGVVFDTGGLSLKPTPGSMDEMKCDMAGGAAVVGAMCAIARNKVPVHVIALVPATDNRPGMNAYVPQDVITMMNGTTVEVLNTDAEGRLLLADALVYAQRYKPGLVIDLATLTGAAVRAVGSYAIASMGTASKRTLQQMEESGLAVYERCVTFPLWPEYGDEMKSKVADLKNLGGPNAGQITAAKFLEHFTDYPWIHLDIAGPAYLNSPSQYRSAGGTGAGVRLLYHFIKHQLN